MLLKPRKRVYFDWDELIDYIAAGRVVPVCGQELLEFEVDGRKMTLMNYLAQQARTSPLLEIDEDLLDEDDSFMDLIYVHLKEGGDIDDIYRFVGKELESFQESAPKPLAQLASIRPLKLFISTTFDQFLARALNEVRYGGRDSTHELAFRNKRSKLPDLELPLSEIDRPVVYQMFGRSSVDNNYAVTEADLLEYVSSLSDDDCRPERLFRELQDNHLLFLGTGHRGWLARFLLRIARNLPLGDRRKRRELLVEASLKEDQNEVVFLDRFCTDSRVNIHADAAEFVNTLHQRISESRPDLLVTEGGEAQEDSTTELGSIEDGALFLSYASEDREAVLALYERLSAARVPVWMDQKGGIRSGNYEQRIRRGIESCSIFVPVYSSTTFDESSQDKRYFRFEWNYMADEVLPHAAANIVKVQPVRIDDVNVNPDVLPEPLRKLHYLETPQGQINETDVKVLVGLYRDWQRRNRKEAR